MYDCFVINVLICRNGNCIFINPMINFFSQFIISTNIIGCNFVTKLSQSSKEKDVVGRQEVNLGRYIILYAFRRNFGGKEEKLFPS